MYENSKLFEFSQNEKELIALKKNLVVAIEFRN